MKLVFTLYCSENTQYVADNGANIMNEKFFFLDIQHSILINVFHFNFSSITFNNARAMIVQQLLLHCIYKHLPPFKHLKLNSTNPALYYILDLKGCYFLIRLVLQCFNYKQSFSSVMVYINFKGNHS